MPDRCPGEQLPWPKPENYSPARYELLRRYLAAGWKHKEMWNGHHPVPNRKTDTNNSGAFSTDYLGASYDYPEADYATRDRILRDHENYQKGLFYFLANDPSVPGRLRAEVNKWGLAKDEFQTTGGWPHAIYVREARRMISDWVQTEADCRRTRATPQPVGMGSYNMDSHNVQRYVDARGFARNEGDVQVRRAARIRSPTSRCARRRPSAPTCSSRSAAPPPTSPTAACAWSRSS